MEKQTNSTSDPVPKLRFPEFKGEWENRKLGDIAKFSKGKGISKSEIAEDGKIECIRYGELYTRYGEVINDVYSRTNIDLKNLVLSDANDVIIPASGETQIDIATASCVIKSDIALGGDLNIIKTVNNGVFLSYYLNNRKKTEIANLAQGISVVHLYSSQLATLSLNLPAIPEQTRIASFFSVLDKKIAQLKQKKSLLEQYKKGVMQKLFTMSELGLVGSVDKRIDEEEEINPTVLKSKKSKFRQLRFKDVDGKEFPKWEIKKLGEVLETIPTKKHQIKSTEYNAEGRYKVIDQGQDLIAGYSDNEMNVFKRLPVIVFGDHTTIVKYIDFEFIVGADGTKLLTNNKNDNLKYLYYNLSFNNVAQEGYKRHFTMLSEVSLQIPCHREQTRIANFLSAIDEKINRTENQIQQTQQYKKGLLQNMFC